jgi:CIC family chloride channel protein
MGGGRTRFGLRPLDPADAAAATSNRPAFWALAIAVGFAAGYAAVAFRLGIYAVQTALYGVDDYVIHSRIAALDPVLVVAIPVGGALAVGWMMARFSATGRPVGVADVIEASALRDGRVDRREGAVSAAAALVTLSTGGSTGREGPVVHLAATLASWVSARTGATGVKARDILGCAVAAAVSASFNAPLAGALFALEVVLRHYAVRAFGPIAAASVAGAVVSRVHFGDVSEFALPDARIDFYAGLPAFSLLGVVCGLAAVALIRAIFVADRIGDRLEKRLRLGTVRRAGLAGLILGVMALGFPHVIGVGYETTSRALTMGLDPAAALLFAAVKLVAVAVTLAGRLGGGVFSPSLMLGALTGAAFGGAAEALAPGVADAAGLYALAGMGAVAAAVLGAPISTILIVFELTGDWQAGVAVMTAVSVSTVIAHRFVRKSLFLTQLARAGVDLAAGPEDYVPRSIPVASVMRPAGAEDGPSDSALAALLAQGAALTTADTLERALPLFDALRGPFLPVVAARADGAIDVVGTLHHVDALKAFNRALIATHREEHA